MDYDTITFVRREILPSGKSRAFINDTPVNLTTLRALGNRLVDIHSQHQTLMLANSNFQLEALDGYVGNGSLLTSYNDIFRQYVALKNELTILQQQQYELKKEEDFLNFQFEELDKVALNEEEFKKLEERQQFLSHAEEVMNALGLANSIIEEDEHNLIDRIALIKETLSSVAPYYPKGGELIDRLESIRLELKDMADETAGMLSEGEVNPAELAELTEKRDEIYRLQQKYRASTVGELIALKKEISDQLLGISGVDEKIEKVTKELDKTTKELQKQAGALTNSRKSGIASFISAIKKVLGKLGMKEAVFEIRLTELNDYTASGIDRIDFWFSANKGVPAGEISKIASGGELSRLMLAIKSLISEKSMLPTMVFDEIDSGVSGDIAGKTGNIMLEMAKNHQLIVITHLPQIASKAHHHYKVFKQNIDETTRTNIVLLDDNQRVEEIAAMLSDETVSQVAREAAKDLLR